MNPIDPSEAQRTWNHFLEAFEPLRPELFRYCRFLTRSALDAEDLAQETLTRGLATLARLPAAPANPRAWLFRVATNAWIDLGRRAAAAPTPAMPQAAPAAPEPGELHEAAGLLLTRLSPQERAAVVLKEAFDLTLDETAQALGTTVGAVKAALHRGRGKLALESVAEVARAPVPAALEAFCEAFRRADLDGLAALLLDTAVVEVVGATIVHGPDEARRTVLPGMLFGSRVMADPHAPVAIPWSLREGSLPDQPRLDLRWHRDRWIVLTWYAHKDGEAVRAVTTFDCEGDRVVGIRNHFFCPELLEELGRELGVPVRHNGYRWWHSSGERHECGVEGVVERALDEPGNG